MYILYRHLLTAYKTNDCRLGLRFVGHATHSYPDLMLFRKFIGDTAEHIADQICFDKEPKGNVSAMNDKLQLSKT